jgi:hypothetical protein
MDFDPGLHFLWNWGAELRQRGRRGRRRRRKGRKPVLWRKKKTTTTQERWRTHP